MLEITKNRKTGITNRLINSSHLDQLPEFLTRCTWIIDVTGVQGTVMTRNTTQGFVKLEL